MQSDPMILIIATIPVVIVGGLFNDWIENNLRSSNVIATTSIIFGLILLASDKFGSNKNNITLRIGLLIGLAQVLALIPGVSRSGITITMGLFMGLGRVKSAKFSFLLAIPVILGASVLQIYESYLIAFSSINYVLLFTGLSVSFLFAYFTIHWFLAFVTKVGMFPFVVYRVDVNYPSIEFCTDNAAMIALTGCFRYQDGIMNKNYEIKINPRWSIENIYNRESLGG